MHEALSAVHVRVGGEKRGVAASSGPNKGQPVIQSFSQSVSQSAKGRLIRGHRARAQDRAWQGLGKAWEGKARQGEARRGKAGPAVADHLGYLPDMRIMAAEPCAAASHAVFFHLARPRAGVVVRRGGEEGGGAQRQAAATATATAATDARLCG